MRIGVDIDETVGGMLEKIIPLYNIRYNDFLDISDFDEYDVRSKIKPGCKNLFEEFADDDLIASMTVADDVVEVLTALAKYHDIYFVTAGHPYTARARDDWLMKHFSFYRSSNLIVCREKQLLNLDVLIDDYENNLIGGGYLGLLMTKHWNEHFAAKCFGIERIFGWKEVPAIIEKYERRVRNKL